MRLLVATDAWAPQVNGVVRTLEATRAALEGAGHRVLVISPDSEFFKYLKRVDRR